MQLSYKMNCDIQKFEKTDKLELHKFSTPDISKFFSTTEPLPLFL